MTNLAYESKVLLFPGSSDLNDREQGGDVKACLDDGYYRIANQIGLALCKVSLSDRESRLLQAVMMKTFGYRKDLDWICYNQLADLTGIDRSNIGKTKTALVKRKILITDGKKIGVNPVTNEWIFKSESKAKRVRTDSKKSQNRLTEKESEPTHGRVRTDSAISQNRLKTESEPTPTKENKHTKDNITKDMSKTRQFKSQAFKDFFAAYPAHRKGGTDAHAWKAWKSEKLTEQDTVNALDWLRSAAQQNPAWRTDANGQFVHGITKFIRERLWLTPLPQPQPTQAPTTSTPNFHNNDTSWASDLGW